MINLQNGDVYQTYGDNSSLKLQLNHKPTISVNEGIC
jgi:hypothetical protein